MITIALEVLGRIIRHKNGMVTDSMTERGIVYKVNYGVALHTIKSIAVEYAPNHELAQVLFARDEREAKLAALFIEDPQEVTPEQFDEWSSQFTNMELAEQACSQLLYKTPHAFRYSKLWIQSSEQPLQLGGWMLALRLAQKSEQNSEQLKQLISFVNNAVNSSQLVQQAAVKALVRIANHSKQLEEIVRSEADKMTHGNPEEKYVADEILAFLST